MASPLAPLHSNQPKEFVATLQSLSGNPGLGAPLSAKSTSEVFLPVVVGKRTAFRRAEKPRDDEELDGGLFEIALSPSFRALPSPPRE